MRRAQIVQPNEQLVISETEIPSPPNGGLVVKTTYCGICHSDLHQWENEIDMGDGTTFRYTDVEYYNLPVTPGHEIAGTIYSIGANQQAGLNHAIGDRVVVYTLAACGNCGYCDKECSNKCKERVNGYGFARPGGYANFVVVFKAKHALKLPDSIPFDVGCMLPCSGLTAYNAVATIKPVVEEFIRYEGRASVFIVGGAGSLGLWALQIAKAVLPKSTKIVVADLTEDKLAVAKERGCDDTFLWKNGISEEVLIELTKSRGRDGGFDAIMDFVNTSETSKRAFKCLRPNGMLAMIGLFGGCGQYSLPNMVLWSNRVTGVLLGSPQQLKELIELVTTNKLIPPPFSYFKLENVSEALVKLKKGTMRGRGIIKFD